MNADNKLLIAIRGYNGWTSDLEVGMIAASRHGRLQSAYESARARYFAEAGPPSTIQPEGPRPMCPGQHKRLSFLCLTCRMGAFCTAYGGL